MNALTFAEMTKRAVETWETKNGKAVDVVKNTEALKKHFDPSYKGPRVPFKEIMTANDFGGLFTRVVSDALQMPIEPQYIGVNLFSRTIQLEPNTVARFPIMGAVVASDVPNNMPIPRQDPAFTQQVMSVDALRAGIAFDLDPDFLDDSTYNIVGFLVEAGRRALIRHKEKKVWEATLNDAHVMFDNSLTNSAAWTSGKGDDAKNSNGSMAFDNFVDMMAGLVVNGYTPTDIIANPLAWAILHKDPILRAQFFTQGAIGSGIWTKVPGVGAVDGQQLLPWGMTYHVSRFMPISFDQTLSTGVPAGSGACNLTDLLMVDRNNPIIIVEREGMSMRQWEQSPEIEMQTIAMKEKYAVYGFDQGRSAVKAKNIRLVDNHAPLYNIGTINL